ncbi:MAG: glycine dehydrogenase (aminomethyl-transferring), partial [Candidatus Dadabacteria bacterium]
MNVARNLFQDRNVMEQVSEKHDDYSDTLIRRHIGPSEEEKSKMLQEVGCESLEALIKEVVPETIQLRDAFKLSGFNQPVSERDALRELKEIFSKNKLERSLIGTGYTDCIVPAVIQRNILENPGWYTQYTPYQAEISQGRLEALFYFQTMISDLTALPVSNASLLDEATAAAEAMSMSYGIVAKKEGSKNVFLVADNVHPQTRAVIKTRADAVGIEIREVSPQDVSFNGSEFGLLLQYPGTLGDLNNPEKIIEEAHRAGVLVTVASDLLSLALIKAPGELGADIAVGSAGRFGVPLGYGGPHAAFLATRDQFKRSVPGRIVGLSRDSRGRPAYRLALQTREQHIRREKATSNICTAQVLLAIMATMYAVYHGPEGIRRIAKRVAALTARLRDALKEAGINVAFENFFDTLYFPELDAASVRARAEKAGFNLRYPESGGVALTLDEKSTEGEIIQLARIISGKNLALPESSSAIPQALERKSSFLTAEVFNRYRSETEFLRYIKRLESRDLSLAQSMIPLGSCTMKLNATSEMLPLSWPEVTDMHPFAPQEQARGYRRLFSDLEKVLAEITGFDAVSLQPNAGSQGEYSGLIAIRRYHKSRGDENRRVCLIPKSAHGTNPASAVMAGYKVVAVECDLDGNISLEDLKHKTAEYAAVLGAIMITYPSTHGVFEEEIVEICET